MFDRLDESHSFVSPQIVLGFQRPLIFAPHPDDEVFGCGGLLALWSQAGHRPRVVVLTDGRHQAGDRQTESREAAGILGYDISFWQIPDRALRCSDPLIAAIEDEIKVHRPDVVLAPTLAEPHPDHQATTLALTCALARLAASPDVLLYESGGTLVRANALIDISQVQSLKDKAMALFVSQETFQPYRSRITARDHFRALSLGPEIQFAEAFYLAAVSCEGWQALLPALEPIFLHRRRQAAFPEELPLVSVVVRTIGDPHLELTISSVLAQTYPRIEVLIVDALGSIRPRELHGLDTVSIRWLQGEELLSRPQAANKGLLAAEGEYIIFLDEDDLWTPEHLQKLVNALDAEPNALAAHTDVSVVGVDGREFKRYDRAFRQEAIRFTNILPIHSVLFRRSVITKYGCSFTENLSVLEDWDFWLQIANYSDFTHVPGISAIYRYQDKSGLHKQGGNHHFHKWREKILTHWLKALELSKVVAAASWYAGRVEELQDRLDELGSQNSESLKEKANLLEVVSKLKNHITDCERELVRLNKQLDAAGEQLLTIESEKLEQSKLLNESIVNVEKLRLRIKDTESKIRILADFQSRVRSKPFRFVINIFIDAFYKKLTVKFQLFFRRARNAIRYLLRGDWEALFNRIKAIVKEDSGPILNPNDVRFAVLSPPHTNFIAQLIEESLNRINFKCMTLIHLDSSNDADQNIIYFVISPQYFEVLPPPERRIIFQVEQAVSDRWFDKKTIDILENSLAVIEFSRHNIPLLASKGIVYPHVFYVPFGGIADRLKSIVQPNAKTVLFYGDASSPRRKRYLEAIAKRFSLHIVTNEFGERMAQALSEAAVVINIHFYDGAMLETTRIFECLSLGKRIVSESAPDLPDYPGLEKVVDFVPVDNIEAMESAIEHVLQDENSTDKSDRFNVLADYLSSSQSRFNFMFLRALLGKGLIDFPTLERGTEVQDNDFFALSLPETFHRRKLFEKLNEPEAYVFDGIRAPQGWIGCALSYKYLCRSALRMGKARISVMEDDVLLPPEHLQTRAKILDYLDRCESTGKPWDIFVGVIAQLREDTIVSAVERFEDLTFVTINRMTSMVYNIYNQKAMKLIGTWDETNTDANTNTIDRFLEAQSNLRVVTILEPLFDHREDANSTLWGFKNSQYTDMISETRSRLRVLVEKFDQSKDT